MNHIDGEIVSMFGSSSLDLGFIHGLLKPEDYKTGICCFSSKHVVLTGKRKDWLIRNQDNVSEWIDM